MGALIDSGRMDHRGPQVPTHSHPHVGVPTGGQQVSVEQSPPVQRLEQFCPDCRHFRKGGGQSFMESGEQSGKLDGVSFPEWAFFTPSGHMVSGEVRGITQAKEAALL